MTPQERQLVVDLFDRLASLENERRDPDADRVIREGLAHAPNAVYAMVQTVLLQEEALKRANQHIEELERAAGPAPAQTQSGGFLDNMRNVFMGQSRGGSVPSVRPAGQGSSGAWGGPPPQPSGYQPQPGYPPPPGYMQGPPGGMGGGMMGGGMMGGGGGSFLGTAAATAAGVIGGSMLMNGIRSAFSNTGGHQAFGGSEGTGSSPWGGGSSAGGELSREAGVGDIGNRNFNDPSRQDARQDAQQDLADDDAEQDAAQDYADDGGYDDGGSDSA
jgi:hypothetical protein